MRRLTGKEREKGNTGDKLETEEGRKEVKTGRVEREDA